jgi:hypothetical protein
VIVRLVGLLVLLAGCRQILGFEGVVGPDAASDAEVVPDASACVDLSVQCVGDVTLRTCTAIGEQPIDSTCNWGCIAEDPTGDARCGAIEPTGGQITTADLAPDDTLLEIVIPNAAVIDDNGQISGGVRQAGMGVIGGIEWEERGQLSVYRFKSVDFQGAITVTGSRPVVIVADGPIAIQSVFDARGTCSGNTAGPGGGQGGNTGAEANGNGGGRRGTNAGTSNVSGGGGGGFGAVGSPAGDAGGGINGALGGDAFGDLAITTLAGGGGGGGGGRPGDGGVGGGGGGAVFLISNTKVSISEAGGINAGGCGGTRGQGSIGGGGGGGAGGAILIEAPVLSLDGALAVNGGGGGGASSGNDGSDGALATTAASGGSSLIGGTGGNGGAGSSPSGSPGMDSTHSGGGGGAVGRIRINTRTGSVQLGTMGFTSPPLAASGSTATVGVAAVK